MHNRLGTTAYDASISAPSSHLGRNIIDSLCRQYTRRYQKIPGQYDLNQCRAGRSAAAYQCSGTLGGDIISIENRPDESWVEVLSRPLDYQGQPASESKTDGRFMAQVHGFLDPALYAPERQITVYGKVTGTITRLIGEYNYRYPTVSVQTFHLWPLPVKVDTEWYDPWYPYPYAADPFFGFRSPYFWNPYFHPLRRRH